MKECSFIPALNPNKERKASKIRSFGLGNRVNKIEDKYLEPSSNDGVSTENKKLKRVTS
jgi:hypothetical protein